MSDLLLEWLSYRGSGRSDNIPADLLAAEAPVWMLADLAALGHLDSMPDQRWRIAPPVLAAEADDVGLPQTAILCGARTPVIRSRLQVACDKAGAEIVEIPQPLRPAAIRVTARTASDLPAIAGESGLIFQRDAAFTLLACLPTISNWPRSPCEMVIGRVQAVKRFSRRQLSWVPSSLEEATQSARGFFRIQRDWDWISLLKEGVDAQAEIESGAGRLAAAAKAKCLQWSPNDRLLRLPFALYPPMLIARALVLCTGLLPLRDRPTRTIGFHAVPTRITRLALALTGLRHA